MIDDFAIADTAETGALGVPHLKRIWSAAMAGRQGQAVDRASERQWDHTVLNAVGIGLHQTIEYLFSSGPSFAEFEDWIVTTAGAPDARNIERLQATVNGEPYSAPIVDWLASIDNMPPVLSADDLAFWDEHGFVVLKDAVSVNDRRNAEALIWDRVEAAPDQPNSWYQHKVDHGIMVELIQHPSLEANRRSQRIHKAFAQLWETADLWVSADRCGFHPPQRDDHPFPGPDLHWDLEFSKPLTFGTQGILYLTDTPPEQGALTVVPGFHRKLPEWHAELPTDADPNQQNLHDLGAQPIGAKAGDMVIWHQFLPHGSRPNLGEKPRIVQYINLTPAGFDRN